MEGNLPRPLPRGLRRPPRRAAALLAFLAVTFSGAGTAAAGPRQLALGAGAFDVGEGGSAEGGLELRFAPRAFGLEPVAGGAATTDGAAYLYGGLRRAFSVGGRWRLSPGFAIGLYEDGDGKDLGGVVEFRSSLELSVRVGVGSRLGLAFYHLSNAGIYDRNPGSNSLILIYSFALAP